MKEKREENENIDDEDNERLTPIQFESFNVSLPENEFQIPQKRPTRIIYLLMIIIFIIVNIFYQMILKMVTVLNVQWKIVIFVMGKYYQIFVLHVNNI